MSDDEELPVLPVRERPQNNDQLSFNVRNETLQQLPPKKYNRARIWLQTALTTYDNHHYVSDDAPVTLRGTVRLVEDQNEAGQYTTNFELFAFDARDVQMKWLTEPRFKLFYDPSITIKSTSYTYRHDTTQRPSVAAIAQSKYKDDGQMSVVIENGRLWPFEVVGFSTIYVVVKGTAFGINHVVRTFFPIYYTQLTEFQSGGMYKFRSMDGPNVPFFTKAFIDE